MRLIGISLAVCGLVAAQPTQAPSPVQRSADVAVYQAAGGLPIYRITVVERSTKTVNYNHRGGATKIDFRGTPLLAAAHGEAKVESKQGYIEIEVEFRALKPATEFGPEYLTYVMWAITPEGRATNLGEVLLNGSNSKLDVTTELQSFGLIVTAEPYFAVTQPSDVVVMENVIRADTSGATTNLEAKYELLKRGQYTLNVNTAEIKPMRIDSKVPLEVYEARNAIQIARWTGAQQYASETLQKAEAGLAQSETYLKRKVGRKPITTVARQAVQMAEDARIITVKKIAEEQLANERQAGAEREATAETARIAAEADTARVTREAAEKQLATVSEANRMRSELLTAAQDQADAMRRESAAQLASAQTEAARLKGENDAKSAAADAEANRLKAANDAERANSLLALDRAARDKAQAEAEKAQLRAQLLLQFNAILQTRDTARGLIVNMSDVLFDTGKYTLRPIAREKLAKVAGIVSGHPSLKLDVEGHTDSVGSDAYNQKLSENRGNSVRDYLTHEGMAASSVTSKGLGESQPVASNDTAKGRQENRRVEIVISGDIIGTEIGAAPLAAR